MALPVREKWDHYSECHALYVFNGVVGVGDRWARRLELVLAVVGDDRLGHHSTLGFLGLEDVVSPIYFERYSYTTLSS